MIRLKPTTIAVTMDDVKDFEVRRRYRKYLSQQEKRPKVAEETQCPGDETAAERIPSPGSVLTGTPKSDASPAPEREPLAQSPIQQAAGTARADEELAWRIISGPVTTTETRSSSQQPAPTPTPSSSARLLAQQARRPPRDSAGPPDVFASDGAIDPIRQPRSPPTEIGVRGFTNRGASHVLDYFPGRQLDAHPPRRQAEETTHRHRNRPLPATPGRERQESEASVEVAQQDPPRRQTSTREPEQSSSGSQQSHRILTRSATKLAEARNRLLADETGEVASSSPDPDLPRRIRDRVTILSSSTAAQSSSVVQGSSQVALGSSSPRRLTAEEPDELGFQIYDDSQPAMSQPQTPQNLPEARHRGRVVPAYTAPANNAAAGANRHARRRQVFTRSRSPEGLETPGFRGLFGGTENRDEATLFEEARRRIMDLRRAEDSGDEQQG